MDAMRRVGWVSAAASHTLKSSLTERLADAWLLTVTAETVRSEESVLEHHRALKDGAELLLRQLWDAADGRVESSVPVADFGGVLSLHMSAVRQGTEELFGFLAVVRVIGVLEREWRQRPGGDPSDRGHWAAAAALRDWEDRWIPKPATAESLRDKVVRLRAEVGRALEDCRNVALAALDEPVQEGER